MCRLNQFKVIFNIFTVAKGLIGGFLLLFALIAHTQVDTSLSMWGDIGSFEAWEHVTDEELGIPTYIEGNDFYNVFAKRFQIKTVKKYHVLVQKTIPQEKQLEYTLSYDKAGQIISKKTFYQSIRYVYSEQGFLNQTQSTLSNNHVITIDNDSFIFDHKKKTWANGFPYTTLKQCLYFDKHGQVLRSVSYSYIHEVLVSKVIYYNAKGQCFYCEYFEYEFYPQ